MPLSHSQLESMGDIPTARIPAVAAPMHSQAPAVSATAAHLLRAEVASGRALPRVRLSSSRHSPRHKGLSSPKPSAETTASHAANANTSCGSQRVMLSRKGEAPSSRSGKKPDNAPRSQIAWAKYAAPTTSARARLRNILNTIPLAPGVLPRAGLRLLKRRQAAGAGEFAHNKNNPVGVCRMTTGLMVCSSLDLP